MSDPWDEPWSNNPNAPPITSWVHLIEKGNLAGMFLGLISYGIVITLFFQCMSALLNPVNRGTRAVKWGLVVQTSVMFTLVTVYSATYIDSQLVYYIDHRLYGDIISFAALPLEHDGLFGVDAIFVVPTFLFISNQCLADGFLLYRCCIIYSMNYWVIIFSCLIYLTSVGACTCLSKLMAMLLANSTDAATSIVTGTFFELCINNPELPTPLGTVLYFLISLCINVFLTLAIIARLALHNRNIRNVMGDTVEASRLYESVISMLVESCALYAGSLLAYIVTSYLSDPNWEIFLLITAETQVIAPFLIILRVANRTAVTRDSMASGDFSPIRFRSREQSEATGNDGILPDGNPVSSTEMSGEAPGEVGVVAENAIEEVPLEGSSQTL